MGGSDPSLVLHGRLEPYTKVKYSKILFCQVKEAFSIYKPTRARSVHENNQHVQGWNPNTRTFFT